MVAKSVRKKTSSMKKSSGRRSTTKTAAGKAPESFFHKMLTAEGWKRLMMGKAKKR